MACIENCQRVYWIAARDDGFEFVYWTGDGWSAELDAAKLYDSADEIPEFQTQELPWYQQWSQVHPYAVSFVWATRNVKS